MSADEFAIAGLGTTLQAMVDHPSENFGFALAFTKPVEFASSQAPKGRPRLALELEDAPIGSGADLSVVAIERSTASGKAPEAGEEVTYTAHVRNVGTAPSGEYATRWIVGEREGAAVDGAASLAPGAEATYTVRRIFTPEKGDARFQPIALRVTPKSPDTNPRNDALVIQEGAKWIELVVDEATAAGIRAKANARGSHALEDWVQSMVETVNDVFLDRSRFSFAPDGVRDRVAIGKITVASAATSSPADLLLTFSSGRTPSDADIHFIRAVLERIGSPALAKSQIEKIANGVVPRGTEDYFAGIGGFGDTRYDGNVPSFAVLPYEPVSNPLFDQTPLEATGLLSATEVATLNGRLDGTLPQNALPAPPKNIVVRAQDYAGQPLVNTELSFFQSQNGRIEPGAPAFTVVTNANGSGLLPNRDANSPFGRLEPDGGNHTLLVRAVRAGVTEWAWLKAWQAIDTASRNPAAVIMDLRFNLPGAPLDVSNDLAKERIVVDKSNTAPAKLAAINDDNPSTDAELGAAPGEWVEIDLGRDRTVGEVVLQAKAAGMWKRFDILAYATGQKSEDAEMWMREADFGWTVSARGESVASAPGVSSVSYRGKPRRFRYLRIINRGNTAGRLNEIRVTPAVISE